MKKISYQEYYDKVLGGWLGKLIGGTIGGPIEGQKTVHKFTYYSEVPTVAAENDDNDFQLVWLHALQERGIYISSEDLMEEWLEHIIYPFCEYGYAVKNFRRGIKPPVSGWFNNDYFKECMGCPVRSEIWGFISPGNPELAVEYAKKDGVLDHAENALWAEMFLSAIESMVFFEKDIKKLLQLGLDYIPANCRLAECINNIIKWHRENESWLYTRRILLDRYGSPDMTSALQNIGITILALLYGKGDFEKTMLTAANCGYDSDCTCATAGAIVGAITGTKGIPSKWKDPMHDKFKCGAGVVGLERDNHISALAEETCRIGLSVVKELNKEVEITDRPPCKIETDKRPPAQTVELKVNYNGFPSIGYDKPKEIDILVKNNIGEILEGILHLEIPESWQIEPNSHAVKIAAEGSQQYKFSLSLPEAVKEIPSGIRIKAVLADKGNQVLASEAFGLAGESIWLAIGPFWTINSECIFSNKAGMDIEYLPEPNIGWETEPDFESGLLFEKRIISCPEDRIDLNALFSMQGPAVLYLVQYIKSPEDKTAWFMVGSNDAVKIWLNGEMVHASHLHRFTMPFNEGIKVDLKKGINKIVVKVARCGANFDFRFGIRKREKGGSWHNEQWIVDLAGMTPWAVDGKTNE